MLGPSGSTRGLTLFLFFLHCLGTNTIYYFPSTIILVFFHSSSVFFSTNNQLLIILADHPFTTLSVNHLKLFLLPRLNDWVGISTGDSGTPSLVCRYFDHFHVIVSSDQADVNFVAQGREDYRHGHGFNAWYYGLSDEIEGVCPTIDQGRFFSAFSRY